MGDNNCKNLIFKLDDGYDFNDITTECITITVTAKEVKTISGCIPCAEYGLYKKIIKLNEEDKKKLIEMPIIYTFDKNNTDKYALFARPLQNNPEDQAFKNTYKGYFELKLLGDFITNDKLDEFKPDTDITTIEYVYQKNLQKTKYMENILKRFALYKYLIETKDLDSSFKKLKDKLEGTTPQTPTTEPKTSSFGSTKKPKHKKPKRSNKKSLKRSTKSTKQKSKRSKNKSP
jgi:hypothetical protein